MKTSLIDKAIAASALFEDIDNKFAGMSKEQLTSLRTSYSTISADALTDETKELANKAIRMIDQLLAKREMKENDGVPAEQLLTAEQIQIIKSNAESIADRLWEYYSTEIGTDTVPTDVGVEFDSPEGQAVMELLGKYTAQYFSGGETEDGD